MSSGAIKLAPNLLIGLSKVMAKRGGQRFAIIGKSGGGKTNTLKVFAEQWMKNGWPLVVIDPMNNFRSLRDSGLPLIVAGMRKSADLQLTIPAGYRLAQFCFNERVSIVLDTSFHHPDVAVEVLKMFLETLWQMILRQDEDAPLQPLAILIDEAHLFVPQSGKTEITDQLIDMSKRGRQLGLSMAYTTQRPAAIDKEFLTQSNVLIAHKVSFGDVNIVAQAFSQPPRVINTMMAQLIAGQAMVSGDSDLVELGGEDFILAQIDEWNMAQGERFLAVMKGEDTLRPINPEAIESLRKLIGSRQPPTVMISGEEAQQLRERIQQLEDEIRELKEGEPKPGAYPARDREHDDGVNVFHSPAEWEPGHNEVSIVPHKSGDPEWVVAQRVVGHLNGAGFQVELAAPLPAANKEVEVLSSGARKVLTKLADIYPMRVTRKQLATLADYTDGGGAFNAHWSALRKNAFISDLPSHVEITIAGFRYLGRQPRLVPITHTEIMRMWSEVLPERTFEVLTVVVKQWPNAISLGDLALAVDMTAGGGGFNSHIGKLRLNGLVEKSNGGNLRANQTSLKL